MESCIILGDVNISLELRLDKQLMDGELKFGKYFKKTSGKPDGRLIIVPPPNSAIRAYDELTDELPNSIKKFDGRNLTVELYPGEGTHYEIIKYTGFLCGAISKEYRLCHGAGFKVGRKGILLVGGSGNGKSTLATELKGEVLSDDSLLVSPSEMLRIGRRGFLKELGTEDMYVIVGPPYNSPIDYVFLLDNKKEPDHLERLQVVHAERAFDDVFYDLLNFDKLEKFYLKQGPLRFEAPIFEIGTKSHPSETAGLIKKIISES